MPEHADAKPGVDYMLVAVCPVCGGQANYLKLGRAECDGFNGTQHPGPVSCELVKVMPWDGSLVADREKAEPGQEKAGRPMAEARIGCTTDYVFRLQTGDRYVAAVVEDELQKSLEAIAERLNGHRFDLVLEKRDQEGGSS